MYSLLGLLMGACIAFFIGIVRSSREYHELERRPSLNDEAIVKTTIQESPAKDRPEQDRKVIYASRLPINSFRKVCTVTLCVVLSVVGIAVSMEGFDDLGFLLVAGAVPLLFLSPIIGVLAYNASSASAAIRSKQPFLEFHNKGMICHSKSCGPVQEILWADVTKFIPVLPALGEACSVQIEHRVRGETKIVQSRYMINVVDIELAQFVSLLELNTGLTTNLPRSNLYP